MDKASTTTNAYDNDRIASAPNGDAVFAESPSEAAVDMAAARTDHHDFSTSLPGNVESDGTSSESQETAPAATERHDDTASSAATTVSADDERERWEQQRRTLKRQQEEFEKNREKREREFAAYQEEETRKLRERLEALWHTQTSRLMQELESVHAERLKQLDKEAENIREANFSREQAERERRTQELDEEFAQKRARLQAELDAEETKQRKKMTVAAAQQEKAEQQRKHMEDELTENRLRLQQELTKAEVQNRQVTIIRQTLETYEKQLQATAEKIAEDRIAVIQARFDSNKEALQRANEENRALQSRINFFETLANRLGGREPEEVLHELTDKKLSLDKLREELSRRPPQELKTHYDELERREKELAEKLRQSQALVESMRSDNDRLAVTEMELNRERKEKELWKQRYEALEILMKNLESDIKRLKSQYGKNEERDERIRTVETPYITEPPALMAEVPSEIEWLDTIEQRCADYGFKFPRRILNAFHTSLKVAEWSPITVLAGVSGTGKSELPRLYALFGGLTFMPLPVQPNWDSQESMLGFFNTIDNVFDAQPVLRFLAQCCKKKDKDYPGLADAVNLILLDEMNLAHIELYFAEFLSKLELRRSLSRCNLPLLEVKLGADMEPYRIPLQRNILFTGTMNQDETTKSLSDKVLDRSAIIHFPRPRVLHRRSDITEHKLPAKPDALLPFEVWRGKWVVYNTHFANSEIALYKEFIQNINGALEVVGRALGHRVWQSIEAYMANHPDVKAARNDNNVGSVEFDRAMHVAFEDQLVQKVMPKLRGIETRGIAKTKCLDEIARMLSDKHFGIVEDFQLACTTGYGQFIWNSAKYLDEPDTEQVTEQEQPDTEKERG